MIKRLLIAVAMLCAVSQAQVSVAPILQPHQTFVDQSGSPCAGCSLYSYVAGTTIPQPTYTDASGGVQNPNPLILSVQGGANIWVNTGVSYKFVLQNSLGATVWTADQVRGLQGSIFSQPLGAQSITEPSATNFDFFTSSGGKVNYNSAEVLNTSTGVNLNPTTAQTVTQPVNTIFNFITSGTGVLSHNGNNLIDTTGGTFSGPLNLNSNKINNAYAYYNYLYSGSNFVSPTAVTNRTWANPEFYYAVTDNSPYSTNPNPQADLTATPIIHIESTNNSPNDAVPVYLNQTCSNTVEGNPPNNNGCVGLVAAVSNTATSMAFPEAANFIMQINSTNPLVQAQGVELNAFNWSGSDSLLQPNGTFSRGPYFGYSSTAGGNNRMVAAFHSSSQGGTSGWQYGFWAENASEADFMVGDPQANSSQDGIEISPLAAATSGTNYASMPIDFRTSFWNGSSPSPFGTYLKAIPLSNATNPTECLNVSFTTPGSVTNICNDGSVQVRGTSWRTFNGAPSGSCSPGDFATNASPISASTVLYVCYPANTWTPITVP